MEKKKREILKICSNFDFTSLTDKELEHLKVENDLIKGFNTNKNKYKYLKQEINPFDEIVFFDICHLLGIFNKNGEDLIFIMSTIKYLYHYYSPNEIISFTQQLNDIHYNEKYANILIKAILDESLKGYIDTYAGFYNEFKKFSRNINKINHNRIKIINMKKNHTLEDELKIQQIRKVGKSIIMTDVADYIAKIKLLDANPTLKAIRNILLLETYNQEELTEIIQFYKYALTFRKRDESYLKNIIIKMPNQCKVSWLSSTDPINLVLGYILKICCTFTGSGSKIMIDSILNPKVKNVVIQNRLNNVLAKATCIYHDDYLFCNSLAFTPEVLDKLSSKQESDYYYYYLKSINYQYHELLKQNKPIKSVRIGETEELILNCLKGHDHNEEFADLLQVLSYNWLESSEELFDHKESEYSKQKKYLNKN